MSQPRTNPDPEQLLGGHAAGILTEQEKSLLYKAALENQEIFDALADEEALRELLADPAARQRLLASLPDTSRPKIVPFWRRPMVLGLAASLLLMITTTYMVRRQPVPVPDLAPKAITPFSEVEKPAVPTGSGRLKTPEAPIERKQEIGKPEGLAKKDDRVAQPVLQLEEEKKTLPPERPKPKDEIAAAPSMSVAGASLAAPAPAPATKAAAAQEQMNDAAADTDARASLDKAEAHSESMRFAAKKSRKPEAKEGLGGSGPRCVLEPIGEGRFRLSVGWKPGNHLYVLKRTGAQVTVLTPRSTGQDDSGLTESRFEFPFAGTDLVDVYLLREANPDPASLPAEGSVKGCRKRLTRP